MIDRAIIDEVNIIMDEQGVHGFKLCGYIDTDASKTDNVTINAAFWIFRTFDDSAGTRFKYSSKLLYSHIGFEQSKCN